jgi:UrcA family protein
MTKEFIFRCLLASIASAIYLSPAFSQDTVVQGKHVKSDVYQEIVTYDDLNLMNDDGAKALYSRVRVASQRVCRQAYRGGSFEILEQRGCTRETNAATRPQVVAVIDRARSGLAIASNFTVRTVRN